MAIGKDSEGVTKNANVSNLLTDPELTVRFQKEAVRVAGSLYYKYYQVYEYMDVEDVVSECWQKIIRQSISYDPTKGARFNTFVRMIVTQRLIELTRVRNSGYQIPYLVSLEDEITYGSSTSKVIVRDTVPDSNSEGEFRSIEFDFNINQYKELFNTVKKSSDIIELLVKGYTAREISDMIEVSRGDVWMIRRVLSNVSSNIVNGSTKTLADVMYGESQNWIYEKGKSPKFGEEERWKSDKKRRTYLTNFCWLITDEETGINFEDIVVQIIEGSTLKGICKALSKLKKIRTDNEGNPIYGSDGKKSMVKKYDDSILSEYAIRRVLRRYEEVLI